MTWWDDYGSKLREPFDPKLIDRIPKGGTQLDYVGHAAVTDRLIHVDAEWTWTPLGCDEHGLPKLREVNGNAELWITLTVGGRSMIGVGTAQSKKQELSKELIGDAIRNAAMRMGVALDLWSKSDLDVADAPVVKLKPTPKPKVENQSSFVKAAKNVVWKELAGGDADMAQALWNSALEFTGASDPPTPLQVDRALQWAKDNVSDE